MSITTLQQPERITPSNLEMIFTLSSSNKLQPNFKYVLDVWQLEGEMSPGVNTSRKIGRLKVRPNKEGNAIVDVSEIVADTLQANILKDYEEPIGQQYFSMFVGGNNGYDSYFVTKPTLYLGFSQANANNHISDFETKDQIREFRVLVGEEYEINGVKTLTIDDRANRPETSFFTNRDTTSVSGILADFPVVDWTDAGLVYPTGVNSGVNWYIYTDQTETTIVQQGSFDNKNGTVTPINAPGAGYILKITERYSGLSRIWQWNNNPGEGQGNVIGWEFLTTGYPQPNGQLDAIFSPPSFFSWVATVRREDRLQRQDLISVTQNDEPNYQGRGNHLFNWRPYYIPNQDGERAEVGFLSPMPYQKQYVDTFPFFYDFYEYNFYKKWYAGQPIMMSFFNSYLHEFVNEVRAIGRYIEFKDGFGQWDLIYNTKVNGGGPLTNVLNAYPNPDIQEIENRVTTFTDNQVNTQYYLETFHGGIQKVYYWLIADVGMMPFAPNPSSGDWEVNGNTPYIIFDRQDLGCFETEPINFVYLNPLGGWDTLTFSKKSTKKYSMDRKTFEKSKYIQGQYYNRLSYEEKTRVYNQSTKVIGSATSDYVNEYDAKFIEDLILSPYVYIVTNTIGNGGDTISSNPELIPIQISNKSVEEYKKNYEKLKQFSINFEYDNIEGYRVQL